MSMNWNSKKLLVGLTIAGAITIGGIWLARMHIGPPAPTIGDVENLDPLVANAVAVAVEHVESRRGDVERRFVLGLVYEANDLNVPASICYRQVLDKEEDHARAWFRLAHSLERQGKLSEALDAIGQSIRWEDTYAPSHWIAAFWMMDQGDIQGASAHAQCAIDLDPDHPAPRFASARLAVELERMEEAIAVIEEHGLLHTRHGDYGYLLSSQAYRALGQDDRADEMRAQVKSLKTSWSHAWSQELSKHRTGYAQLARRAGSLLSRGDFEQARPLLLEYLEHDPDALRIRNMLANCQLASGDIDGSLESIRKALAIAPTHYQSNLNFAIISAQVANRYPIDLASAIDCARRAAGVGGDQNRPWAVLGELYELEDKPDDAIASYQRAIELGSSEPEVYIHYGKLLIDADQWDLAEPVFIEARELFPTEPAARIGPAHVALGNGELVRAKALISQIRNVSSSHQNWLRDVRMLIEVASREQDGGRPQ